MASNKKNREGNEIKGKKYETLIIQLWELLPNFCHFNSPRLSSAFAALIQHLEPMVNKNLMGLRPLALKVFSELIQHCKKENPAIVEVKKTLTGMKRISADYIDGLAKLYIATGDATLS